MERYSKVIKKCIFIGGITEIVLGLAHFFLPNLIYKSEGFQQLNSAEIDIVTLCIFSVGILLLAVGAISILCAKKYDLFKEIALFITSINLILWLLRIIFEITMPVRIMMISIDNPTLIAMPLFIVLWIVFACAVLLMWADKQKNTFLDKILEDIGY